MNTSQIDHTEFGIGEIQFAMEDGLCSLEITASEEAFEALTEDKDGQWSWALYPPKIYFLNVPYAGKDIVVDEDFLTSIMLYFI